MFQKAGAMSVGTANAQTREEWVAQQLRKLKPGWRLLDAGAGERPYKNRCSHLKYVAQDFAKYDGKGDGTGLQTGQWNQDNLDIVSDITAIPEGDASFDAILCTEVFEHIPQPVLALKEFARLLKPGGVLILTAPFISFTHFAPFHFSTGFNRYFYEHHLPQFGLKIVELSFNGNFFEVLAQELLRAPEMAQRYAQTRMDWRERRAQQALLKFIERCARADNGSSEFAAFGIHVMATKT